MPPKIRYIKTGRKLIYIDRSKCGICGKLFDRLRKLGTPPTCEGQCTDLWKLFRRKSDAFLRSCISFLTEELASREKHRGT